jgi:hypothetical protein
MRVIKSDTSGVYVYQKIFKYIYTNNYKVVIWQIYPTTNTRVVSESRLNAFYPEKGLLHFELTQSKEIDTDLPIYCYSEEGQLIFKSQIKEMKTNVCSVLIPSEIKLLDEADVKVMSGHVGRDLSTLWYAKRFKEELIINDIFKVKAMSERSSRDQDFLNKEFDELSLDEEDKLFADKRESPRARPKIEKWVRLKTMTSDEVHILKLFDLSRGGIGFVTMDLATFPKNSKIMVVGFEEFDLDDPLIAQVMSHRPIDELEIEFKVGCKFDEGQA